MHKVHLRYVCAPSRGIAKKMISMIMEMVMSEVSLSGGREFWKLSFELRGGQ